MSVWKPNMKVFRWRELAEKWGRQTGCPPALILAVIEQESGGGPEATRHEPEYMERYEARCREIAHACGLSLEDVATSYGLMQLMLPLAWGYMGTAARKDPVAALLDPDQNVRFGAAHLGVLLRKELARHNDAVRLALGAGGGIDAAIVRAAAGRFNGAGSGSAYARNVCALWRLYEGRLKEA
ncbi:hypothetical protein EH55_08450 [Synergistes jonesii]|uniref:Transglycosylase SLT domain-containing protein n=2 Tax=Synergistes jonesii TaxID=2754 RepID=A0A073IU61_9BACT|nr:lytic transglycosylase domain-containing protein [Synergistes jonesii]KEJ93324.1 hypothetical protein EH55_08450 [Synergistes jonesii]